MGLVRFDGKTFKVFYDKHLHTTISRVVSIQADRSANLHATFTDGATVTIAALSGGFTASPIVTGFQRGFRSKIGYWMEETVIDSLGVALGMSNIWDRFDLAYEGNKIVGIDKRTGYIFLDSRLYYTSSSIKKELSFGDRFGQYAMLDSLCLMLDGNHLKAWQNGEPYVGIDRLEGDIQREPAFSSGHYRLLWCPTGTFIYCASNLYRLVQNGKSIKGFKVLDDIPIKDIRCVNYDAANDKRNS